MASSFLCTAALLLAVLAAPVLSHSHHNHTNAPSPTPSTTPSGGGMNGTVFQVTSISPSRDLSTSGSDIITLTGTGFSSGMMGKAAHSAPTAVQVGSSSTVGLWNVPKGISMGVWVSFSLGAYTSNATFDYGAPTVTSLSPALIPQGRAVIVTVTGTNLGYTGLASTKFASTMITGQSATTAAIVDDKSVQVNIVAQSAAQSPTQVTASLDSRQAIVANGVTFEVSSSSVAGAKKVELTVQNYVEATFKADMAIITGVASADQIFIVSVTTASQGSEMFRVQEYDLRAASTVQFIVLPTVAEPNAETTGLDNVEKAARDGSLASKFPSASGLKVGSKTVTIKSNPASAEPEGKVSKGWIAAVAVTASFAFLSIVVVIYRSMQGPSAPKESMEPSFKSPVVSELPKAGEGSSDSGSGIFSTMRGRIKNPFRKSAPADAQKTTDAADAPAGGAPMQELRVV